MYALLLIEQGSKVLLLQRGANSTFAPLSYSLMGGKIEQGEAPRQAAIREAHEELGIIIKPEDLNFVHVFYRKGTETEFAAFIFKAKRWQGTLINKEPEKHAELAWFEYTQLPASLIPAHKQALECISRGQFYSEHGW